MYHFSNPTLASQRLKLKILRIGPKTYIVAIHLQSAHKRLTTSDKAFNYLHVLIIFTALTNSCSFKILNYLMEGPVKNLHINVSKQYFNKCHIIFDLSTRSKSVCAISTMYTLMINSKNILEV